MKPRSCHELLDEFKHEITGEWLVVYSNTLFVERIIRKCFFYYANNSKPPDTRESWKRAIIFFLDKNLKNEPQQPVYVTEKDSRKSPRYPPAKDVINEMYPPRPELTDEERQAKLKEIKKMIAAAGNLGMRDDDPIEGNSSS